MKRWYQSDMGHHASAVHLLESAAAAQNACAACHSALSQNPMTCQDRSDIGELPIWFMSM